MSNKELREQFESALSFSEDWNPIDWTQHATTDSSRILVAADLHIPKHDTKLIGAMLALAVEKEIDTVVWLGDLMDIEEFSSFGVDDPSSSFNRNCKIMGKFIKEVGKHIPHQIYSGGNHEYRINRATKGVLNLETIALTAGLGDMIEDGSLVVEEHPTVMASVGNWLLTHPAQFGMPGTTPNKLAMRYRVNCMTAHEHAWNLGRSEDNAFWTVSAGGLFDPKFHKYIQHKVTNHRSWVSGFCTLIQGRPRLYHSSEFI